MHVSEQIADTCRSALLVHFKNEVKRANVALDAIRAAHEAFDPVAIGASKRALKSALESLPLVIWFNKLTASASLEPESEALEQCKWCFDMVYEEAILCPSCWGAGLNIREDILENFVEVNVVDLFREEEYE